MELTPAIAGTSVIISFLIMGVALIFQVYLAFLNWKQSKVKDSMVITNSLLAEILKEIKRGG